MSFLAKLKAKTEALKVAAEEAAKDLAVDEPTRTIRINICNDCDRLFKPTGTCKDCGCFVNAKTWLKGATCPRGKW